MKKAIYLLIFLLFIPFVGQASDCGCDPVYEQNFTGRIVSGVRVRDIACMDGSNVLTTLSTGATISVIAKTDGWYRVRLSNGIIGWVGQQFITVAGEDRSTNEVIDQSLAMTPTPAVDMTFALKHKGKIFLQTQSLGEAYYVDFDGFRHYMENGAAAYAIMRELSLGISEANFNKINKDTAFKEKLKGRIVLRVEALGEAYYISPRNLNMVYLKDGNAAYELMRQEGWGITNGDLNKIPVK